jgi:hypothetical protein
MGGPPPAIIAITVSVNYARKLDYIAKANHLFFKHWYVITEESDTATIEVCKKYPNIEILYYNFRAALHSVFDKGGALREAQGNAHRTYPDDYMLVLDSDIVLPTNFETIMGNVTLHKEVLYCAAERRDYYSEASLNNDRMDKIYPGTNLFAGFFQLYFDKKKYYNTSHNCAECDMRFKEMFRRKKFINGLTVKHLGREGVNWNGVSNTNNDGGFKWN